MSIARTLAVLLTTLLIGMGGLSGFGGAMAMTHISPAMHVMDMSDGSDTDCPVGQVASQHAEHGDASSKTSKAGCCAVACGQSILATHEISFSHAGWQRAVLLSVVDHLAKGRSVSPMLRPPRLSA